MDSRNEFCSNTARREPLIITTSGAAVALRECELIADRLAARLGPVFLKELVNVPHERHYGDHQRARHPDKKQGLKNENNEMRHDRFQLP